jgi:type II secretion system protein H
MTNDEKNLKVEKRKPGKSSAFTLIELILVMAILIIAVSITAPALGNFFRASSLDSEARRLLALSRQGQARAVSEGLPVELWIDQKGGKYGLEVEPSFGATDAKAVSVDLDPTMQVEAVGSPSSAVVRTDMSGALNSADAAPLKTNHPDLPRIRFLPDGSIADSSPTTIRLTGRDGGARLLSLARSRLNYEIKAQTTQ